MKLISITIMVILLQACAVDKSGQSFSFPSNEIAPAPAAGGGGGASGIQILSTAAVTGNSGDVRANLVFDGVRLIVPIQNNGSFAGDAVTSQYFSTSLVSQGSSSSTHTGIDTTYGHFTSLATTGTVGQSTLFWGTTSSYTSDKLSVRNNSTGAVVSTVDITFLGYGCSTHPQYIDPIAYCNGNYYGVCVTSGRFMRFFSFNSSGALQSAVTTTVSMPSDTDKMSTLTCYNNAYLFVAKNTSISKYDLNFQLITSATISGSDSIKGITTDGSYLYLQGAFNTANGLPYFFNIYKATLGNLN